MLYFDVDLFSPCFDIESPVNNRPSVAGAVLRTPLSLFNSVIHSFSPFLNIYRTPSLPNCKS